MKKIYLSLFGVALTAMATAQHQSVTIDKAEAYHAPMKAENFKPLNNYSFIQGKASGDTIFYEDFSAGIGSWVTGGATDIWEVRTQGPQGQYSNAGQTIESTTAADGFAIFDADENQSPTPGGGFYDHVGYIESPAVDLTGYANVSILFQQAYRHCCAGGFQFLVQFSDDDFAANVENYVVNVPGVGANTFSGTDTRLVDISNFIAGATDLTNVKMRFLFDGTGGTTHYFWQVDDIALIESLDNYMSLNERILGHGAFQYPVHFFPEHQLTPISFSALVENRGVNAQNDVTLTVTASENGTTEQVLTSTPIVANPGDIDSLVTTDTWTPQGTAGTAYDLDFVVSQTENEQFPVNNTVSDILTVTDTVFGVDNATISGSFTNFASQPQSAVKIGNVIEVPNDTYITSLTIYIANNADAVGQQFFGELRIWDAATESYQFLEETSIREILNGDLGSLITLKLNSPVQVTAGSDLLVLAGHFGSGDPDLVDVAFGMSRSVPEGVVLGYDATDALFLLSDPRAIIIRANMNPNVSVDAISNSELKVSNSFPNPFSEMTTVEYSLEAADQVSYELVDMAGRSILSVNEGMVAAGGHKIQIDGAGLSNGIYHLNITTSNGQVSRKLVVNK